MHCTPDPLSPLQVFDLTAEEAEVIDCEEEPLDCVTWRVVKKEPGLQESGKEGKEGRGTGSGDDGAAAGELRLRSVVSLVVVMVLLRTNVAASYICHV